MMKIDMELLCLFRQNLDMELMPRAAILLEWQKKMVAVNEFLQITNAF